MSKIEHRLPDDWHPDTWSSFDQEQEEEAQEVSNLASFVAICLFIGMIAIVADAICHMSELPV